MKLLKLAALISLLYFFSVESTSTKYKKAFLKNLSTKLELDHVACKGCMQEKKILNDATLHFTCPQDKSSKCMRCSVNNEKQNECKVGCFRVVAQGAKPCLIQKDYDNIFKKRKFKKTTPIPSPDKKKEDLKKEEAKKDEVKTPTPAVVDPTPKVVDTTPKVVDPTPKVEDPKVEEAKQIEKAQKEIFIVKPVEQDVMFFLIDSSGSMGWDSKICQSTCTDLEWTQYVKEGRHVPRIKIVKEVLKNKIQTLADKQKFYIWESSQKRAFDNLNGAKSKDEAKAFVDSIETNYVFYYEDAFKALEPKIQALNNVNTVVSLLTDGGITNEKPSESATLKTILDKGVKKWELFLYSEGGCTDPQTQAQEKTIMDALKKTVGL
jgi:hypothetical protein